MTEDDLVIIGDEAFTKTELEQRQKQREKWARYRAKNRERIAAYFRAYRAKHGDRIREQHRESAARGRRRIGTLHDLSCQGPRNCACREVWRVRKEPTNG